MPSILESIFNPTEATGISNINKTLALSSVSTAAMAAGAYLTATLEATTPEARRLFQEYLTQCLLAHDNLTGLVLKRDWVKPYDTPENQLSSTYQESEKTLSGQTQ